MTRAAGRHRGAAIRQPTTEQVDPNSDEGRGLGMSDRMQGEPSPIPGGRVHVANPVTVRQHTPAPDAPAEIKPINAHGVPPGSATTRERADMERGPNIRHTAPMPHYAEPGAPSPAPVAVYIVPTEGGPRPLRRAIFKHYTVPAFNNDPILLCGVDPNRTKVRLMNADAATDIQIGLALVELLQDPGAAAGTKTIGGVLLKHGMTTYQDVETQDEIWAVALSSATASTINVIVETAIRDAAPQKD